MTPHTHTSNLPTLYRPLELMQRGAPAPSSASAPAPSSTPVVSPPPRKIIDCSSTSVVSTQVVSPPPKSHSSSESSMSPSEMFSRVDASIIDDSKAPSSALAPAASSTPVVASPTSVQINIDDSKAPSSASPPAAYSIPGVALPPSVPKMSTLGALSPPPAQFTSPKPSSHDASLPKPTSIPAEYNVSSLSEHENVGRDVSFGLFPTSANTPSTPERTKFVLLDLQASPSQSFAKTPFFAKSPNVDVDSQENVANSQAKHHLSADVLGPACTSSPQQLNLPACTSSPQQLILVESNSSCVVEMNLRLDMDFEVAGQEGSTQRQNFIKDLMQDLGDASGTGASDFNILKLSPGSVIVEMTAQEKAAQEIYMQSLVPNSRLRNGKVTRFTDKITLPRVVQHCDEETNGACKGDRERVLDGHQEIPRAPEVPKTPPNMQQVGDSTLSSSDEPQTPHSPVVGIYICFLVLYVSVSGNEAVRPSLVFSCIPSIFFLIKKILQQKALRRLHPKSHSRSKTCSAWSQALNKRRETEATW